MGVTVSSGSPIAAARLVRVVRDIQRGYRQAPREIAIVFVSGPAIRKLNRQYRRHDRSTTVLSFHLGSVGELYLSIADIRRLAKKNGQPLAATLIHLVVHGTLHLAGLDHETSADERRMLKVEHRLAKRFTPSHIPHHVIHQS